MNNDYLNLLTSLNDVQRADLAQEMRQVSEIDFLYYVDKFQKSGFIHDRDSDFLRRVTVIALKAIKENRLTVAQYATFNVFQSAIRDLLQNCHHFTRYEFVDERGKLRTETFCTEPEVTSQSRCNLPYKFYMGDLENQTDKHNSRIIKDFFSLDEQEWVDFIKKMGEAPRSERLYPLFSVPLSGSWSPLMDKLRELVICFQDQDLVLESPGGKKIKNRVFPIPSFSMFRAFIEVKGALYRGGRKVRLIPVFGMLSPTDYGKHKMDDGVPFGLFFPSRDSSSFRIDFDGFLQEGWLAFAIHEVYHALREQQFSSQIAKVRNRWVKIATDHPNDQKTPTTKSCSEFLIDGELIFSHPKHPRSAFRNSFQNQSLAFFIATMEPHLHDNLKEAFIRDMVENPDEYIFGREDLSSKDQALYDRISEKAKGKTPQRLIESAALIPSKFLFDSLYRMEQLRLYEAFQEKREEELQEVVQLVSSTDYLKEYNPAPSIYRMRTENLLFGLKQGKFSIEQIATFHIFDNAIRNIVVDPSILIYQKAFIAGKIGEMPTLLQMSRPFEGSVSSLSFRYDYENIQISESGDFSHDKTIMLKKYFSLSEKEWEQFVARIKLCSTLEQQYIFLELPVESASWSHLIRERQKIFKTCMEAYFPLKLNEQYLFKKGVIVPSFSMFQIFLKIRMKNEGVTLVPVYHKSGLKGMENRNHFRLPLYFPKSDSSLCCHQDDPDYRDVIESVPEGPYARILNVIFEVLAKTELLTP